jgi:hypothetical protein
MSPRDAVKVLNKFHFGTYLDNKNLDRNSLIQLQKANLYKYESVGQWLSTIDNHADHFGGAENVAKLKEAINFHKYLDVLVDYVNHDPSYLNREYTNDVKSNSGSSNPADSRFNVYQYHQRDNTLKYLGQNNFGQNNFGQNANPLSLIQNQNTITKLINGISSGATGYTNMSPLTSGFPQINFGLNPLAFPKGKMAMVGGGYVETEVKIPKSSPILKSYFDDIVKTTKNMGYGLSDKNMMEINEKFEKLSQTEDEIRNTLSDMIAKSAIYNNSNGHINLARVDSNLHKELLQKHSNYINAVASYNKRAINFLTIIESIIKHVVDATNQQSNKVMPERKYNNQI